MHDHHHGHDHSHSHSVTASQAASKAFVFGIVLNLIYVIAEAVAGLRIHSIALLSDAGHNLGDVAGLALSLLAFRLARVKPNGTFTYGYKKATVLAALANAVLLLTGIGILGFESVRRLWHPQPVEGGVVAWIAGLGIVINGVSAAFFFRNKKEMNAKVAYMHLLTDVLVSAAVMVTGIVIHFTHIFMLDSIISLVVLTIILFSTWSLLTESLRLNLDAVPGDMDVAAITDVIAHVPGVQSVHHLHLWAMSTTENALTAHVVMEENTTALRQSEILLNIKHELLHQEIRHTTIEVESADMDCPEKNCSETVH